MTAQEHLMQEYGITTQKAYDSCETYLNCVEDPLVTFAKHHIEEFAKRNDISKEKVEQYIKSIK
jgi:hypothetical protein